MKIYILPEVHSQIMYFVNKSNVEISGLGRVEKTSSGDLVVTKAYLLKQENGPASTDIDPEAVAMLQYESREDKGDLNFWWHSHVNMNAFWSGTDMATIREFGGKGYLLATVFNKRGEYQTAYFQGSNGFLPEIFVDKIETSFSYLPTKAEQDKWEAEFKEKAVEKKYEAPVGRLYSGSGAYDRAWGLGWGDESYEGFSSVPSKFNDPNYYSAPKSTSESGVAVGVNTGFTMKQMVDAIREMYKAKYSDVEELEVDKYLLLCDVFEAMFGYDPTDNELDLLFMDIIGSEATMENVIEMLTEAVVMEQPVKTATVTSFKGKQKTKRKGKQKLQKPWSRT